MLKPNHARGAETQVREAEQLGRPSGVARKEPISDRRERQCTDGTHRYASGRGVGARNQSNPLQQRTKRRLDESYGPSKADYRTHNGPSRI